jgi:hypothetical protein
MACLRFHPARTLAGAVFATLVTTGCDTDYSDRILDFDVTGSVRVVVFRDENLSFSYNPGSDLPIPRAGVVLRRTGTSVGSRSLLTDSSGAIMFAPVPAGRYQIDLASAVLGDSLLRLPTPAFTVQMLDTVTVLVGTRFPSHSISEARSLPVGKKVFVRGILLNTAQTFGDSTVHIADSVAAIRMSRVRPFTPDPGDSVQMLGIRATRDGQPTFNVVTVLGRGAPAVDPPVPHSISTALAGSADGGKKDADFVRILIATISDTITVPDGKTFNGNDASGPVRILLDNNINFGNLNRFAPGVRINVSGLLVPNPGVPGSWILKPRTASDITILP